MQPIRFYIEGSGEAYLKGEVDYNFVGGEIHITFKHEDMDAVIMGLEDLNVEVTYGGSDDVS